jgi:hypothetical protein
MPIIDLQRRLVEVGRLRMGKKGDRGQPQKLDTWRLTSRDKTRLEAAATLYGGTVQPWAERDGEYEVVTATAELPILLLPGQTLSLWYETWSAGGCQRRCDGEREILTDAPCVCDTESGDRTCKPTTRLSVMLPDVPGLGCWRTESHGYYAAVELSATAAMLERATALGQLLPARLRIDQRRKVEGGKTTRYAVPVIDIDTTPRHALSVGQDAEQNGLAYTPAARELFSVTVEDGLEGAARSGAPRAITARSAAPIPEADDLSFGEPVTVDDAEPLPEPAVKAITGPQRKKANLLVGKLREAGRDPTEWLYTRFGREPVPDDIGDLHWSPLRESLTRAEAVELIDALEGFVAKLPPQKFEIPESART